MIPTNKSEPKHLRIEGTSHTQKTDENSAKKTRKSNELQPGYRHNHESFHSRKAYSVCKDSDLRVNGSFHDCVDFPLVARVIFVSFSSYFCWIFARGLFLRF
jgi:hypothetical protein